MSERLRLETLCDREGKDVARRWAQWAEQLYRQSIDNSAHFASQADWRPRFEDSIRELATFAKHDP